MNLIDLVNRQPVPEPWAEGEKIPWNDPAFSARMLAEHLSQAHDAASRRAPLIDKQVDWIHHHVLGGRPAHILDLGCGPGFYCHRLARLGHVCVGIDFGPASIAHARRGVTDEQMACTFVEGDVRTTPFGASFDLVMFIYGEFNVFTAGDARAVLVRANRALKPGGRLLLEPHRLEAIRTIGQEPPSWYASAGGLFSDRPHLCLRESFWDEQRQIATERHYVVDAASGAVTRYAASMQGYADAGYRALLADCGFDGIEVYPSLHGGVDATQSMLVAMLARKGDPV